MRPTTRHASVIEGVLSTLECMNGPRGCAGPVKMIREGGFVLGRPATATKLSNTDEEGGLLSG